RLEESGFGLRRRRHGDLLAVVDVVGEPNRDPAVASALERAADDLRRRVVQADVVERDVEAVLRRVEEFSDGLRDLGRGLPAVRQFADLDQFDSARSLAL
ncbi:MAG: hypothetical protein M3540_07635, partial [Actinomycetota bacterium]|nr:hypothetical protein [Actinomycetota bacterium]